MFSQALAPPAPQGELEKSCIFTRFLPRLFQGCSDWNHMFSRVCAASAPEGGKTKPHDQCCCCPGALPGNSPGIPGVLMSLHKVPASTVSGSSVFSRVCAAFAPEGRPTKPHAPCFCRPGALPGGPGGVHGICTKIFREFHGDFPGNSTGIPGKLPGNQPWF